MVKLYKSETNDQNEKRCAILGLPLKFDKHGIAQN